MDNELKENMKRVGIDVDDGVNRFMGNEALFEKFFKRFKDDKSYADLVKAISDGDTDKAFIAAHTLKGTCGNLSMIKLAQSVSAQVEYLRSGDMTSAAGMMPEITAAYEDIISIIS